VLKVKFGPEPGVPAKLDFTLTGGAASGTIAAGTDVAYTYSVKDAYDGPVDNPLSVIPSDPNTTVFDDGISALYPAMGRPPAEWQCVYCRIFILFARACKICKVFVCNMRRRDEYMWCACSRRAEWHARHLKRSARLALPVLDRFAADQSCPQVQV
jgi:hypothetical protein